MDQEHHSQRHDGENAHQSEERTPQISKVIEAKNQNKAQGTNEPKENTKPPKKRSMGIRQKWNITSLPNKLNIALTFIICFATVVNVLILRKQVYDQDEQVRKIERAITDGITDAKDTVSKLLDQNKTTLESALGDNRSAIEALMEADRQQSADAL
jgi:hypothetical protein